MTFIVWAYGNTIIMDTEEAAALAKKAIENARRKADCIAKIMGETLSEIITVMN